MVPFTINNVGVGGEAIFKPTRTRITLFPLNTYLHYILCSHPYLLVSCSFSVLANVHNCNTYIIYSQTQKKKKVASMSSGWMGSLERDRVPAT